MQKEIEIKAKVENFDAVKNKLIELGCTFSEPIQQHDTTFVNFDRDYTIFTNQDNFLRIRQLKNRTLFTLKRPQENEMDCIEKEVEISDAKEFREALELMGYHEATQVHKIRVKAKYQDMEICLDTVKDLGNFIEVEKITEGDSVAIQDELYAFLETLGVSKDARVTQGYDTMVYMKNKNK